MKTGCLPLRANGCWGVSGGALNLEAAPLLPVNNNVMGFGNNPVNHPKGARRKIEEAEEESVDFTRG
jgi:hypothetical protein